MIENRYLSLVEFRGAVARRCPELGASLTELLELLAQLRAAGSCSSWQWFDVAKLIKLRAHIFDLGPRVASFSIITLSFNAFPSRCPSFNKTPDSHFYHNISSSLSKLNYTFEVEHHKAEVDYS